MSSQRGRAVGYDSGTTTLGENVLLLAPSIGTAEREACRELLTGTLPADTRALHVLFVESAGERYRQFERHGHHPAESVIVAVGAGGIFDRRSRVPPDDAYTVRTVADPADVLGLETALEDSLSGWSADDEVVACFDSLSVLLQYADTDRVVRFCRSLTRWLDGTEATAHFHLDPAAHGDEAVVRLASLFDSVVDVPE